MWGVWDHPIKLLDGFWFGLSQPFADTPDAGVCWLREADGVTAHPAFTEFEYRLGQLRITRMDSVPDGVEGMIVTLTIRHADQDLRGMPVRLHALFRADLRPAWLGAEAGMLDGQDLGEMRANVVVFSDSVNPWVCLVTADVAPTHTQIGAELWGPQRTAGSGISAQMCHPLEFDDAGVARIRFFIAGSATGMQPAQDTLCHLVTNHARLHAEQIARRAAIGALSRVETPDPMLNQAIAWSRLITQMLAREVPRYGTGVGAGLPEYPWWFGIDTAYAALPMLQSGQSDLLKATLCLLRDQSLAQNAGQPGRVLHEMSTTGVVFNAGNLVEVPAFTRAVHQVWRWTADAAFLSGMYEFCRQGMLEYVLGRNDMDGDLCPSGRSVIETLEMHSGIETLDCAAYSAEALTCLAELAAALRDIATAETASALAARLRARIRDEWWIPDERLFADARASIYEIERMLAALGQRALGDHWGADGLRQLAVAQALFAPALASLRASGADRTVDRPWLLRHWVALCPLEVGIATPEQAMRSLKRLCSSEYCGEWGMRLHPERGHTMSINTGLLALSAVRNGQADTALALVNNLVRAFGYRTPGAVCEALPDQWCFLQTWSNLGLVSPVIEGFLGISPDAPARMLRLRPKLPSGWNRVAAHDLRVGQERISIVVERLDDTLRVTVSGAPGYTIDVTPGVSLRILD